MKILVLGDSGLLGQALVSWAAFHQSHEVLGISTSPFVASPYWNAQAGSYRHRILRVPEEMEAYRHCADEFGPQIVVNCAALADLKDCEKDPAKAEALNRNLPAQMAADCRDRNARFVHISTDQVFDGLKRAPYTENDAPNPRHVYGKTKWEGEQAVLSANPEALVLRTNIVGFRDRAGKPTFAEWLCESLAESREITLFTDYKVSSVYVGNFAGNLFALLEKKLSGLWHVAGHDHSSKHEFGTLLVRELGYSGKGIKAGSFQNVQLDPPRPGFLAMDCSKAEESLGKLFFDTQTTVRAIARDFKSRSKEKQNVCH